MAAVLVGPVWGHHYFENVVYQVLLDGPVHVCGRRQTRARIHLNQPRLQLGVQQHIEAIQLKAVLVVDHHVLHGLETDVDYVVDVIETLLRHLSPHRLFQVKAQVVQRPLASMLVVVARCLFCDGHIRQVNEHILALIEIVVVLLYAKTGET